MFARLLVVAALFTLAVGVAVERSGHSQQGAIQPTNRGAQAVITNAPHMAFVFIPTKGSDASCGGAIVDRNWVLTARHCHPRELEHGNFELNYKVQAGSIDRTDYAKPIVPAGVQVRTVDGVVALDGWSAVNPCKDDIMLLHVSAPFDLVTTPTQVNKVDVAAANDALPVNKKMVLTGWGTQENHLGQYAQPEQLQTAEIGPFSTGEDCKNMITDVPTKNKLDWSKVYCYSGLPVTSSQGDSGSPYVANHKVMGIVSGVEVVSVVTKVGAYAAWINSVILGNFPPANNIVPATAFGAVTWNPPPLLHFAGGQVDADHWGGMDGCHCNIPATPGNNIPLDPDCKYRNKHLKGCPADGHHYMCANNQCHAMANEEWVCAANEYSDGMTCEKHCGTLVDPDCVFHAHVPMKEIDYHCGGHNILYEVPHQTNCAHRTCCRAKHSLVKDACQWVAGANDDCAGLPKHSWPHAVNREAKFTRADPAKCDATEALNAVHKCL